jgi:hypothetical protein
MMHNGEMTRTKSISSYSDRLLSYSFRNHQPTFRLFPSTARFPTGSMNPFFFSAFPRLLAPVHVHTTKMCAALQIPHAFVSPTSSHRTPFPPSRFLPSSDHRLCTSLFALYSCKMRSHQSLYPIFASFAIIGFYLCNRLVVHLNLVGV